MSTSTPRPRRRIAGERKVVREAPGEVDGPSQPPAPRPKPKRPARPPRPVRTGPSRRPAPRLLLATASVAALVLVLVSALLAVLVEGAGWDDWRRLQQQEAIDEGARTAPAAAERAATAILSYDHRSLEADRDAAADLMTPEYREDYLDTFELVMDTAPERKARVVADVRASGVATPGADRVEVLLFVNQTTVSTAHGGEPQLALNRVVMTMERDGQVWRVDGITSY